MSIRMHLALAATLTLVCSACSISDGGTSVGRSKLAPDTPDRIGAYADDADNDGVPDAQDDCVQNIDSDLDGVADACSDGDDDGEPAPIGECPADACWSDDSDNDGIEDGSGLDSDDDGIEDGSGARPIPDDGCSAAQ